MKSNSIFAISYPIILYIVFILPITITSRHCGVDFIKPPPRHMIDIQKENLRNLKSSDWGHIRIHFDFSYLNNNRDKISNEDYKDLTEKIMPKTKEILEKLLKVKQYQKQMILNAPNCDVYPIPEEYIEGVDADLVIFVIVDISGYYLENSIEAAASHCLQHSENRRPIAGYIQFKPGLDVKDSTSLDYMVWLAIHEISHILVINNSLYDDFINSETLEPIGYDRIIGKSKREDGRTMIMIKSPKVLEAARKHFGCESLVGVPLEFNGGAGTAGSHWAKKYMNTDYMIGDSYGENLISEITLALFEDSGWYKVDYKMANLFLWGKNKGCEFFNKKCGEPVEDAEYEMKSNFKEEFCNKSNSSVCSISHIFRATCRTSKYPDALKPNERYFKDPNMGGYDELTEKCPIAWEVKNGSHYYPGSCRVGRSNSIRLSNIEKICPECACFLSNLRKTNNNKQTSKFLFKQKQLDIKENVGNNEKNYIAGCFQFECNGSELFVVIDDNKIKCRDDESITIQGYDGDIKCPKNEILCNPTYLCKFGCTEKYKNANLNDKKLDSY